MAVVALATTVGLTLLVAGDTLGYDFAAYHAAANRVLEGQPAYLTDYEFAGPAGLFLYPPTFLPLALPFARLPLQSATLAWQAMTIVVFAGGVWALPVQVRLRWLVLLLAALSWPFLYAVKLGQVGPMLFTTFALGWRWIDRERLLGVTGAIGAAVKVQPGLMLAWALLTRRWQAVVTGTAALLALAAVGTLLTDVDAWRDFVGLLGTVTKPITTPNSVAPGAVLYAAGAEERLATTVQLISSVACVVIFVAAALRLPAVASYLGAMIVSQLLSPVLWDHYALLLLLPVAWLVDRGYRWAVLVPLATSLPLLPIVPPWLYPVLFWATLAWVLVAGERMRRASARVGIPAIGTTCPTDS